MRSCRVQLSNSLERRTPEPYDGRPRLSTCGELPTALECRCTITPDLEAAFNLYGCIRFKQAWHRSDYAPEYLQRGQQLLGEDVPRYEDDA